MSDSDREHAIKAAADALRTLAPGHECRRIWGRAAPGPASGTVLFNSDGVPDPADEGAAGNVWAGEPEDIARVVLDAADQVDADAGIHRVDQAENAAEHDQWCRDVQEMGRLSAALQGRPDNDPDLGAVDQALALIARGDKAQAELDEVAAAYAAAHDRLNGQIGQLGRYIMEEIPGEPSQDEGAVECAIRLLKQWRQDSVILNNIGYAAAEALGEVDGNEAIVADPAQLIRQLIDRVNKLVQALRLTVEYVGTDTLKTLPGWSWFDALNDAAPSVAQAFAELTDGSADGGGKPCRPVPCPLDEETAPQ